MSTRILRTDYGDVEYSLRGQGQPLLFVHGGHGNCQETLFHKGFDPHRFCLLTPSRPGYGNTPLGNNQSPFAAARLLAALLDELQLTQVIVIGISAGGLTALALAAGFPQHVSKLILLSALTQKWLTPRDLRYWQGKTLFAPAVETYTWALFNALYAGRPGPLARTLFAQLSTYRPLHVLDEEVQELQAMLRRQRSGRGFSNDLDQDLDEATLRQISCPTLVLHGRYDQQVSLEHPHHAQATIRGAILHLYENRWGHLLWLGPESRAPIAEALRFIQR
jgi:pimeloyl-ACP methyl ester carboxylesterase